MADQQKAEISEEKATKKKVKTEAKAAEPAVTEVVSSPAVRVSEATLEKSLKKGKLLPKNKHRLPRRQKKAQQKAATRL